MRRVCFYHGGCPDGFGAAWAARRAWGDSGLYVARGHDHEIDADDYAGDWVAYVDIAPGNDELARVAEVAERLTVLDHHVTARDAYQSDLRVVNRVEDLGHDVVYDLSHSGAVLSWRYFADGEPVPDLLRYVEDQDLWAWALPRSEEVNAAIDSYPYAFDVWDALAERPVDDLAREGASILRANQIETERNLKHAHPIRIDGRDVEAVNSRQVRSAVGHELAKRKRFGVEWGCVYAVAGERVKATLYSIGDVDVASIATRLGGGGHRNAAGFTVSLERWLDDFVRPGRQEAIECPPRRR